MTQKNIPLSFSDFLRKEKMLRHVDFEDMVLKETVALEAKFISFDFGSQEAKKEQKIFLSFHVFYQGVKSAEIYLELKGVTSFSLNGCEGSFDDFKRFENYLNKVSELASEVQQDFVFSAYRSFSEMASLTVSSAQIILTGHCLPKLSPPSVELIIDAQSVIIDLFLEEGLLPSEVDYLKTFTADRLALFTLLCDEMDDKMLMDIAQADYGYESALCFEFLKHIQTAKEIPKQVPKGRRFAVGEVLSLSGYGRDDGVQTRKQNITQAFACMVLAIGNYHYVMCSEDNETYRLAVIFMIALELEKPYQEAALQFFLWYITTSRTYQNDNGLVYLLIIGLMLQLDFVEAKIKPLVRSLKQSDFMRYLGFDYETELRVKTVRKMTNIIAENLEGIQDKTLKSNLEKITQDILRQSYRDLLKQKYKP